MCSRYDSDTSCLRAISLSLTGSLVLCAAISRSALMPYLERVLNFTVHSFVVYVHHFGQQLAPKECRMTTPLDSEADSATHRSGALSGGARPEGTGGCSSSSAAPRR
jgi:hypothetical protein